jgi:hypothetical protein
LYIGLYKYSISVVYTLVLTCHVHLNTCWNFFVAKPQRVHYAPRMWKIWRGGHHKLSQPSQTIWLLRVIKMPTIWHYVTSLDSQQYSISHIALTSFRLVLLKQSGLKYVSFEVFMAVTLKNAVFWYIIQCGSHENQRFGRTYRHHHQGDKNLWARNNVSSNYQPKHAASQKTTFFRFQVV